MSIFPLKAALWLQKLFFLLAEEHPLSGQKKVSATYWKEAYVDKPLLFCQLQWAFQKLVPSQGVLCPLAAHVLT